MNITIIHFLLLTTESVISKMFAESEVVARYEEVQGVKHISYRSSGSHNSQQFNHNAPETYIIIVLLAI